jgi:CRISPR-associated protein Csb1
MECPRDACHDSQNRILFEVLLKPVQGQRFQPTGFPDLGAATYQAGGTAYLLVESAQSMANRLEATIRDEVKNEPIASANGLSYVAVNDEKGNYLTSSMMEAHRLNSPYIEKCQGDFFTKTFPVAIGVDKSRPISKASFHRALFKYDVNALLHGVFLESLDGRLRVARSLSSFIEAEQVQVAASGGVKNDRIQASKEEGKTAADGFGNLPFHREEFTAEKITAFFSIDLQQMRAFGLGVDAERLLIVLALLKIRRLLDGNLRLRTACDFEVKGDDRVEARRPKRFFLPDGDSLEQDLTECIKKCKSQMDVTTVAFKK